MSTQEQARRIADQVDWVYEQLWHEHYSVGEVLNILMDRGLTRREAVICVKQAQKEMES